MNSRGANGGCSALHVAAFNDQAYAIDAMTEAGADMEMKTTYGGDTPLSLAANGAMSKESRVCYLTCLCRKVGFQPTVIGVIAPALDPLLELRLLRNDEVSNTKRHDSGHSYERDLSNATPLGSGIFFTCRGAIEL